MSDRIPPDRAASRRPTRWFWLGLVILAAAIFWVAIASRSVVALIPIPTPADLGNLDPQVRAHLARLAQRIGEAPRDPDARAEMGLAFAVNGLWAEARQSFLDAQRLGDRRPLPQLYAALALQELGDEAGAIRELRHVTGQFPDFAPGWYRLGRALIGAGDPDGAGAAFTEVTRRAPDAWHGWAGQGEALIQGGKPKEAIAPLERARQLDPSARSVRHLLGQAYRHAGRAEEAEIEAAAGQAQNLGPMPDEWSSKALDHMMRVADQCERADELLARGQGEEAIARLRFTLKFHPANASVLHSLVRALNAGEQPESSWDLLIPALQQRPDEVLLLAAAADTAAALGRTNEALAFAGRALELAPRSAESQVAEANALLAADRDAEAADALGRAIELIPDHIDLRVQLGDLQWHNLGRPEEARATLALACRNDPLHPGALTRLAALEIELGHQAEAARRIATLRMLRVDPDILADLESRLGAARPTR